MGSFNSSYYWYDSKKGFSWSRYLECLQAKASPIRLFAQPPFPHRTSARFACGMKLEAIDPERPALICVVTVVDVLGKHTFPEIELLFWVGLERLLLLMLTIRKTLTHTHFTKNHVLTMIFEKRILFSPKNHIRCFPLPFWGFDVFLAKKSVGPIWR
jgi:hypothetical protein